MFKLLCVPRLLFVCLLSAACDGHQNSIVVKADDTVLWRRQPPPLSPHERPHSLQVFKQIPVFFLSILQKNIGGQLVSSTHAICQSLSWYVPLASSD